jgi:mannose-6-phosphate isomerase-like protein (cupin superfamily)
VARKHRTLTPLISTSITTSWSWWTYRLVDTCKDQWYNQTLCRVNDSVVRLGVMQGEYHWHKHDTDDEFFYVIEGHFLIDLEDRTIDLAPRHGFVVPKGVVHRTRAPERAVILMVENAGIIPTGD